MPRIVLIEDNPQNARLAEKVLKRAELEVVVAVDGESGFNAVIEHEPDLVLVDLGLPDIDGQTVVALLRQQPTIKGTPLIAFTAWPEDHAHEMAKAYGCDGVITKPIDTRNLAAEVMAYIEGQPLV